MKPTTMGSEMRNQARKWAKNTNGKILYKKRKEKEALKMLQELRDRLDSYVNYDDESFSLFTKRSGKDLYLDTTFPIQNSLLSQTEANKVKRK